MKLSNKELFETAPVKQAVVSLVVPTIISQLITVVYNMADTFFIGQIGDPNQVAAASLCMPMFLLLTGCANLFGIGGASLISRCLGSDDTDKARSVAAFSIWSASAVAVVYGIILYIVRPVILPLVGANAATYEYCSQYLFWTVTIGGIPTVLNALLAHLVRSEGHSRRASIGMAMGGVLNIILDPVFIQVFKLNVAGAAIATMLSNLAATLYFIMLIRSQHGASVISLNPRHYTLKMGIPKEVMLVGLPSCMMNFMGVFSNITMNRLMASYCNEAVAGIGIAKKVDMLAFAIATGMSQGCLPLIGYNYSAKNYKRMMESIKTTFRYSMIVATAGTVFLLTCAGPLVRAFIDDPLTVQYGQLFQRIVCITTPCVSITMIVITMFQSTGKKLQPLLLSLLRKGGLDIPVMIVMNHLVGVNGIAWATPIADTGAMLCAILRFIPFWKHLKAEQEQRV
ncbi:MAG: MATE family efflux transporter [Oscillospiraceae bacterium]|nr:MATE family efflux transporter [Oscillospiraceae bacterium]